MLEMIGGFLCVLYVALLCVIIDAIRAFLTVNSATALSPLPKETMCDSREFCRSSRDSTIGINFDALGDVEHFEHLSGDLFDLYKSGEHTDITFVVSGVKFHAHRIILAARCNYFKVGGAAKQH